MKIFERLGPEKSTNPLRRLAVRRNELNAEWAAREAGIESVKELLLTSNDLSFGKASKPSGIGPEIEFECKLLHTINRS